MKASKSDDFALFKSYKTENTFDSFKNIQFDLTTFVFLGTTAHGAILRHSLFTFKVPKMIKNIHQYNLEYKELPQKISLEDEIDFGISFDCPHYHGSKTPQPPRTGKFFFNFPRSAETMSFFKTQFIEIHLNQVFCFEANRRRYDGDFK